MKLGTINSVHIFEPPSLLPRMCCQITPQTGKRCCGTANRAHLPDAQKTNHRQRMVRRACVRREAQSKQPAAMASFLGSPRSKGSSGQKLGLRDARVQGSWLSLRFVISPFLGQQHCDVQGDCEGEAGSHCSGGYVSVVTFPPGWPHPSLPSRKSSGQHWPLRGLFIGEVNEPYSPVVRCL